MSGGRIALLVVGSILALVSLGGEYPRFRLGP
jgi:hypothetical protein